MQLFCESLLLALFVASGIGLVECLRAIDLVVVVVGANHFRLGHALLDPMTHWDFALKLVNFKASAILNAYHLGSGLGGQRSEGLGTTQRTWAQAFGSLRRLLRSGGRSDLAEIRWRRGPVGMLLVLARDLI